MRHFANPRSIAITGASGGIGAALAREYAAPGISLALCGRNEPRLTSVAASCRERGATVRLGVFDLGDEVALRTWLGEADAAAPLDLVIANAGVSSSIGPKAEPEDWTTVKRVFAVNAGGAVATVHAALERMLPRGRGQIAVMGSLAARRGLPNCPSYSASKAAAETYALALRGWLAPQGIGVSVISPGFVRSPMSERVEGPRPFLMKPERAARIIRRGLARNRARIAFPLLLALGTEALACLPDPIARRILPFFHFTVRPEQG